MPNKVRKLYEKCWGCDGTRVNKVTFNAGQRNEIKPGTPCRLCEDGYYEIGLTMGQVERQLTTVDELLITLADLYGSEVERYETIGADMATRNRAANLLQRLAARLAEARRKAGRDGWVPPFKPQPAAG